MTGYIWAWLNKDGSGYAHHPLVYADEATARETWASDTIPDDAPTRRRMRLYKLVEVSPDEPRARYVDSFPGDTRAEQMVNAADWANAAPDGRVIHMGYGPAS